MIAGASVQRIGNLHVLPGETRRRLELWQAQRAVLTGENDRRFLCGVRLVAGHSSVAV